MENRSLLSETTQQAINAIVRRIAVAHELDGELRAELAAHLEDKVSGYLTGQERLTEADAVLLAQSHFGNPEVVNALFHRVHPVEARVSMARRLSAVISTTAVLHVLAFLAVRAVDLVLLHLELNRSSPDLIFFVHSVVADVIYVLLVPAVLWGALLRWRRRGALGRAPWFVALRPSVVAGIVVVSLAAVWISREQSFPPVVATIEFSPASEIYRLFHFSPLLREIFFGMKFALTAAVWLWWCDSLPRAWRSLVLTACIYLVFRTFFLDAIFITSIDAETHQRVSLPVLLFWPLGMLARAYSTAELPALLLGALVFLLMPRRRAGYASPAR